MASPPAPHRRTQQFPLPAVRPEPPPDAYDIYPTFPVAAGAIGSGFEALAAYLAPRRHVRLDGDVGVCWEHLRAHLDRALRARGVTATWRTTAAALKPEAEIATRIAPFLGGDDPLFGTRCPAMLADFFDSERLAALDPDAAAPLTIVYGPGAGLAAPGGALVYVDLPRSELQFRSRAGTVCNLGAAHPEPAKAQYKRFYFVDWPVLNRHKATLAPHVDLFVDEQRRDAVHFLAGDAVRDACAGMARSWFRVRPWFEPGPWGGQWMRQRIAGLAANVPNYAWSFELITPENGLLLADGTRMLEISFDWLMILEHERVLGESAAVFGHDFPIRFDFLDTIEGGNLSIQVHPRPTYGRDRFGEPFTQDETYYILDCVPEARCYLGFQEDLDPAAFRSTLERSERDGSPVDIDRFVQSVPSQRHDLYLIPHGTIHGSARGNLVLEISSTPYIFTFKMYDWLRLDLEGRPRPLNIARAFQNLDFERRGSRVADELISKPQVLREGPGWRLVHLPTHRDHFYDVHRWEFDDTVEVSTAGSFQVMNLVAGTRVVVETDAGPPRRFHYAETFVIPAAAGTARLRNEGPDRAMVVAAFVKPLDAGGVPR